MLSQRDNRINLGISRDSIALARSSAADNSALKTLAIVSTLFLPGTFFSALFSISMFDWHVPRGESVVSERFWIYWAFTAPVTLVVFVSFSVFVLVNINDGNGTRRLPETLYQTYRRKSAQQNAFQAPSSSLSKPWSMWWNTPLRQRRPRVKDAEGV